MQRTDRGDLERSQPAGEYRIHINQMSAKQVRLERDEAGLGVDLATLSDDFEKLLRIMDTMVDPLRIVSTIGCLRTVFPGIVIPSLNALVYATDADSMATKD
jgi:hypothetical protein